MSSQPKDDPTVPGYDWDPFTRRYYRQNVFASRERAAAISAAQYRNEPSSSAKRRISNPKTPSDNVLELLTKRQSGFMASDFEHQATYLKFKNLRLSITRGMPLDFQDIYLLKNCGDSLFGVWSTRTFASNVIESNSRNPMMMKIIPVYHETENITDLCENISSETRIMYIVNIPMAPMGVAMTNRQLGNLPVSPIWCCCSNKFSERYALGVRGAVAVANASRVLYMFDTGKNVHAVQFNQMGNVICAGLHTGSIAIIDRRASGRAVDAKLFAKGVDEVVFLRDENFLICGAFGGKLSKIDMRMFKRVTEYKGHRHGASKTPFSINEESNLLCVTGSDNFTRLWSLNGGKPIKTINPPFDGHCARAALYREGNKCVVRLHQKSRQYTYEV